jgi:hypothetical protein
MNRYLMISVITIVSLAIFIATPAAADTFFFSTGNPDGLTGTLSMPASPGQIETETADDFVLTHTTTITQATFTGLLPVGAPLSNVQGVGIELYHVFPVDSANPPSGTSSRESTRPAMCNLRPSLRWRAP